MEDNNNAATPAPKTFLGMKVLFDKKVGLQPAKLRVRKPKKRTNGRAEQP